MTAALSDLVSSALISEPTKFIRVENNMGTTINFSGQSGAISAELYEPKTAPQGAVVVAYGSDGLVDTENGPWRTMIQTFAGELAAAGFVTLIPDYFATTGTSPGLTALAALAAHRQAWLQALSDTIGHSRTLLPSGTTGIGLLGFSLGSYLCLRIRNQAIAVVEYSGPRIDGIGSPGKVPRCQIHHGRDDPGPGTKVEEAIAIRDQLEQEGTLVDCNLYNGAGHGFGRPGNAQDAAALKESKSKSRDFFQAHL